MVMMFSAGERSALAEEFQEALGSVSRIEKLPADFATGRKDGQFVDTRADEIFNTPGLYLFDVPVRPGEGAVEFRYMPDLEPGKEQSVNQVFFGEVAILDETAAVTPLTVAVKRRFNMSRIAVHEFGAYRYIHDSGRVASFLPAGFVVTEKDGTPSIHFLTLFEPDIRSFDNYNWQVTETDIEKPSLRIQRRLQNLGAAGLYLGTCHSFGFAHGDSQSKNVAISTRTEGLMLTDLEVSRVLRNSLGKWEVTEYDALRFYQKDTIDFIKSIRRVGFLNRAKRALLQRTLKQYFFDVYGAPLRHPTSKLHEQGGFNVRRLVQDLIQATFDQLEVEET